MNNYERIYFNLDAKNNLKVRIIRETTEKITETLTEQKTTDHLGLIKKIETRNFVSESPRAEEEIAAAVAAAAANVNSADDDDQSGGRGSPMMLTSPSGGGGGGGNEDGTGGVKQVGDDLFIFDRTKSYNISKRMRKYDDEVAAGFISDIDSKKIIDQSKK